MNFQTINLAAILLSCLVINSIAHHAIGQETKLEFRSLDNETISSPPTEGHLVICFLGIECPLAKLYAPRINAIASEFSEQDFRFVAINSNRQDSTQEWREFAKTNNLGFPISKIVRSKVEREDLKLALTELAKGKPVSVPVTKPEGCLIGRVKKQTKTATVTYSRDIAPIFKNNCVECHRSGEIGPFEMEDYDEVVGWADMILETVDNGRMPPTTCPNQTNTRPAGVCQRNLTS